MAARPTTCWCAARPGPVPPLLQVIQQSYDERADMWSAGIMMYQLLSGGCMLSWRRCGAGPGLAGLAAAAWVTARAHSLLGPLSPL